MEKLITVGIMLLFLGIILIFIGSLFQIVKPSKTNKSEIKSAGIIFIGPFPFGWASDKQTFYMLIVVGIIMILVYFVFFRRF